MQEVQETCIWSLGWEDPLEGAMATLSSIFAWRILWTEEPDGLQSMGSQRVGVDWATEHTHSKVSTGEHRDEENEIYFLIPGFIKAWQSSKCSWWSASRWLSLPCLPVFQGLESTWNRVETLNKHLFKKLITEQWNAFAWNWCRDHDTYNIYTFVSPKR